MIICIHSPTFFQYCFRGKGKETVVESVLERMQKFADKLEALVLERTNAFVEEKRKTEHLLYEVMPK